MLKFRENPIFSNPIFLGEKPPTHYINLMNEAAHFLNLGWMLHLIVGVIIIVK